MARDTYERLKQVARAGQTITYGEIAPMAGLDMSRAADRNEIAMILDTISTREHREGCPLLSAVVVRSGTLYPGKWFFKLAQDLGIHAGSDDLTFFVQELARVHEYWMKAESWRPSRASLRDVGGVGGIEIGSCGISLTTILVEIPR